MSRRGGQGPRERLKSIRRLERRIAQHVAKVAERPDHPSRLHWEVEIAAFRAQIEKHKKRLGP